MGSGPHCDHNQIITYLGDSGKLASEVRGCDSHQIQTSWLLILMLGHRMEEGFAKT